MLHRSTFALALVLLALVGWNGVVAQDDPCSSLTRCSQCAVDWATSVATTIPCMWCTTTNKCTMNTTLCPDSDAQITTANGLAKCDDTQCFLAKATSNIYFCRAGLNIVLFLAIAILVFSAAFYIWMRALAQLPWKHPKIHDLVRDYQPAGGKQKANETQQPRTHALKKISEKESAEPSEIEEEGTPSVGSTCSICGLTQPKSLRPGEVCFWCNISRCSYFPFTVGVVLPCVCVVLLLFTSVQPWFADPYYWILILVPCGIYLGFFLWIHFYQVPVIGDEKQTKTYFISLAILLRGRKLSLILPDEAPQKVEIPPPRLPTPQPQPSQPMIITPTSEGNQFPTTPTTVNEEQRVKTEQLLRMDVSIAPEFRKFLLDNLPPEEYITWWEEPRWVLVFTDIIWLIHFFASFVAIGVWMLILSSQPLTIGPNKYIGRAMLQTLGIVLILAFGILICIEIQGCHRMYVVTNKRLLILTFGLLGSLYTTMTPIANVKFAAILGYTEMFLGSVVTFSWEMPQIARKLPPIQTDRFAGVVGVEKLLEAFKKAAPSLSSDLLRENIRSLRFVWKIHIAINVGVLALLPLFCIYSQMMSSDLAFVGMLCFMSISVCVIHRGFRMQQLTQTPLDHVHVEHKVSVTHRILKKLTGDLRRKL